jgi:cyclopropane fatty-acyl-phospholipid synthase-like methyltransferase
MNAAKPFAAASEENKQPILEIIRPLFAQSARVLEVGSGTGQHAVYFAAHLPHVHWQCSDRAEQVPGIRLWLAEAGLPNLPEPLVLDVSQDRHWPAGPYDAAFSANTAHIMSLNEVEALFHGLGRILSPGGCFALYGPFARDGRHTSPSNAAFDQQLRWRDSASGVRDIRDLEHFAAAAGLVLEADCPMPVNNRTLIWRRRA